MSLVLVESLGIYERLSFCFNGLCVWLQWGVKPTRFLTVFISLSQFTTCFQVCQHFLSLCKPVKALILCNVTDLPQDLPLNTLTLGFQTQRTKPNWWPSHSISKCLPKSCLYHCQVSCVEWQTFWSCYVKTPTDSMSPTDDACIWNHLMFLARSKPNLFLREYTNTL